MYGEPRLDCMRCGKPSDGYYSLPDATWRWKNWAPLCQDCARAIRKIAKDDGFVEALEKCEDSHKTGTLKCEDSHII